MIKSPPKKQKKNLAHAVCMYHYVCISKLLEEAFQVLSFQAPSVFSLQPPLHMCPQINTLNKKNSMDIFLD